MSVTVQQILDLARNRLGDDQTPGGDQYPNSILLPAFQQAWREYFRVIAAMGISRGYAFYYDILPANVNTYPIPFPIEALAYVEEATPTTPLTISSATFTGSTLTCNTTAAHSLSPGNYVILVGTAFTLGDNQLWCVTTTPTTTRFTIGNAVFTGGPATGGSVYPITTNAFRPMVSVATIPGGAPPAAPWLGIFAYNTGMITFPAASTDRLIKLHYYITGDDAPTAAGDVITEPDVQDYLSVRTAALGAVAHLATEHAQALNVLAIGDPSGNLAEFPIGGILRQRFAAMVRENQLRSVVRPRYRPARTFQTAWGAPAGDVPIY